MVISGVISPVTQFEGSGLLGWLFSETPARNEWPRCMISALGRAFQFLGLRDCLSLDISFW